MCGIGGWIPGATEDGDLRAVGEGMVRALAHRGPDGSGVKVYAAPRAVLAHVRLKVIDLSEAAEQPFFSDDGELALVFNGEIYNFLELRRSLEDRGVRFRSRSDTEVILRQYEEHGSEGLNALDGMFAFALLDRRSARLILMRDRVGKKPLYWTRTAGGGLVFGSEPKALAQCPAVDLELEVSALPELMVYGYVSTPRTLFEGVQKLPPAHRLVLELDTGRVTQSPYWSLDSVRPRADLTVEGAKTEVRRHLAEAVGKRLISDVPLGAFLSGGIDSSIVVAEMARQSPGRVRTFAVGFDDDPSFDESRYAREVAARFDTDHTEIRVSSRTGTELESLLSYYDEPYGDSSGLALHAIAQATRRHVTVVLSGDGGDEAYAGYTRFRGALLPSRLPMRAGAGLRRALGHLPDATGYKSPVRLAARFLEYADRSPDEQLLAWNAFFAGPHLVALLRKDVFGADFDPWTPMSGQLHLLDGLRQQGRDRLDQVLRHNLATYLLDDLLVKADRMTMAVSLEARSPFLDTALLESAFAIPSGLKLRHGSMKWILREAYRDLLPASVLDRRKHGFGVPVGKWWNEGAREMVDDLLLNPNARVLSYLDAASVSRVVREHRSGRKDHGQRIFLLLQLELWLRDRGTKRQGAGA